MPEIDEQYWRMAAGEGAEDVVRVQPKKLTSRQIEIKPKPAPGAIDDQYWQMAAGELPSPSEEEETMGIGDFLSKAYAKAKEFATGLRAAKKTEVEEPAPAAAPAPSVEKPRLEMREWQPERGYRLQLPPSKAMLAFSAALEDAAAGPVGASSTIQAINPIPDSVRSSIETAAKDLGVAITPPVVDFIANSPAPEAFTDANATISVTNPDGTVTKAPVKTMGDAYKWMFDEPIPQIPKLKEAGRKALQVNDADFNSQSEFQQFLKSMSEYGQKIGNTVIDFIPETPGGVMLDASLIGLPALFGILSRGGLSASGTSKIANAIKSSAMEARTGTAKALRQARAGAGIQADSLAKSAVDNVKRFMESLRQVAEQNKGKIGFEQLDKARMQMQPSFGPKLATRALEEASRSFRSFVDEMREIIPARLRRAQSKIEKAVSKATTELEQLDLPLEDKKILQEEFDRLAGGSREALVKGIAKSSREYPSLFPYLIREPRTVISKWGEPGKEFVQRADAWRDDSIRLAAGVMDKIRPILESLNPKEAEAVGALLDPIRRSKGGIQIPAGSFDRVSRASEDIQRAVKPLIERMRRTGSAEFKVQDTGKFDSMNFSPRNLFAYFYNYNDKKVLEDLIAALVKQRQLDPNFLARLQSVPKSKSEFAGVVADDLKSTLRALHRGRMSYPERTREIGKAGLEGFVKDPLPVFEEVVRSWANRVTRIEHFGEKDNLMQGLMNQMRAEGRDIPYVTRVWRNLTEGVLPSDKVLVDKVLAYNVFSKMGLSALRNMTQFAVNTTAKVGFGNVVKALSDYASSRGKDAVSRMFDEVVLGSMRTLLSEATGVPRDQFGGFKLFTRALTPEQFLKAVRFSSVERANRVLSGLAGRHYAIEQANLLNRFKLSSSTGVMAQRRLMEMGFKEKELAKIMRTGKLTADQEIRAGQKIINSTQFQTGALDVPLFWQGEMGRLLTQFKNFGFRQTKFLADNLATLPKNLLTGNYTEAADQIGFLARFATVAQAVGLPIQTIHDFISGKPYEETALARQAKMVKNAAAYGTVKPYDIMREIMANIGSTSGLGLFADLAGTFAPEVVGMQFPLKLGSVLLGPTVSDVGAISEAVSRGVTGKGPSRYREAKRFAVQRGLPIAAAATGVAPLAAVAGLSSRAIARAAYPRKAEKPNFLRGLYLKMQIARALKRAEQQQETAP